MSKCCFFADGNSIIGMGHIMRCIAIAEIMFEKNIEPCFCTRYEQGYNFLIDKGFDTLLYNNISDLDINAEYTVIDSYNVDRCTFDMLKCNFEKLVYIDDLNLFDYNVDLVINTSIYAKDINYNFNSNKKFLLGCEYCILRREFRQITKTDINKNVKDILITTGGSDKSNMTYKILKFLIEILDRQINYHVIIGQAFNEINDIKNMAIKNKNICLYNSPNNMAEILNNCDMAISAGGNTLYELCNLGIPTIAFIYADNQVKLTEGLERLNCISNIGFYDKIDYSYFKNIVYKYIDNFGFRKLISDKQHRLVDENGVYRIVDNILSLG